MGRFARGKNSLAISDRSGQAFPYSEMVKEWNGSIVHFTEFESKHPQLDPKVYGADPQALLDARPQKFPSDQIGGGNMVVTAFPEFGQSTSAFSSDGMRPSTNVKPAMAMYLSPVTISTTGTGTLTTYTTTVQSVLGSNKYFIDGAQQPTLSFTKGNVYRFDQSDSSNGAGGSHPLRFSTTSDGTHSGGSLYTTGVSATGTPGNVGAYTDITVDASAPSTLYYFCTNHSGMGGQINIS
jgi:hypothetical protein